MTTPHAPPPRAQYSAAFAAIYVFWGATFLAIRYIVAEVTPLVTVTIRCALGALILVGWLAYRNQLSKPTAAQWRTAILAGLFLFLGCHALLAIAAALVMAAVALTTVASAREERPRLPTKGASPDPRA